MGLRQIEHLLVFELFPRLALYAALIANGYKAQEVLARWMPGWVAITLAFSIECALLVTTHIIAARRVYNATKLKSAPVKEVGAALWMMLVFFGALSAVANFEALRFHEAGVFAVPFGLAAPMAAGFVAYILADEASTEQKISEHEAERERQKAERKLKRASTEQVKARREQRESELPFACEHCGARFSKQRQLNAHGPTRCEQKQAALAANGTGAKQKELENG